MYTIFIADDEAKVINGLLRRVNWNALEAGVVGYAVNGREAKEKIEELKPDIVITDIYMPGMTGIELMDALAGKTEAVFIIFSAYSEFEYARAALRMEVVEYLIKPVNIGEIEAAVKRAKERAYRKKIGSARKSEEYELMRLLDGNPVAAENSILERGKAVMAVLFALSGDTGIQEETRERIRGWKLMNGRVYTLQRGKYFMAAGVRREYDTDGGLRRALLAKIAELTKEEGRVAYWGVGCLAEGWEELEKSVCAAEEMVSYSAFYQKQLSGTDRQEEPLQKRPDLDACAEHILMDLYGEDPGGGPLAQLQETLGRETDIGRSKAEIIGFLYRLCSRFEERYKTELFSKDGHREEEVVCAIINAGTREEVWATAKELIEWLGRLAGLQEKFQGMIGKIQAYIAENLERDINLGEIAKHVGRNPSYVSHIFRQETGETLFEYIMRMRMEKAIRLLRQSGKKIQEIASAVGYEDQSYFCQVFKRYTGRTAGSFRKGEQAVPPTRPIRP